MMKEIFNRISLLGGGNRLTQRVKKSMLMLLCMVLGVGAAWAAQTPSTRSQQDLPAVPGFTLQPGVMYVVNAIPGSEVTITATAGNGLNVAPKGDAQAPILFIPQDVTLKVYGANGNGMTGGGAGIYVPSNAELIITGSGKLEVNGGNAGNGGEGGNGGTFWDKGGSLPTTNNAEFNTHDYKIIFSGAGGNGGNGGGGAGAAIGGFGGAGGVGGQGGASVGMNGETSGNSGNNGNAGGNGSNGATMGKVYITGSVTVKATAGAAGTAGASGTQGYTTRSTSSINYPWMRAGGGGAGAGGGAGIAVAKAIGGGAPGAGAGGGGGAGATGGRRIYSNSGNRDADCYGGSAVGASQHHDRDQGKYDGAWSSTGGVGAAAGTAGTAGGEGTLYIQNSDNVKDGNDNTISGNSDVAPEDMQITITFINDEFNSDGTKASDEQVSEKKTINIGEPLPDLSTSAYKLVAPSKYFAGYYSEKDGLGYRIYKGIDSDSDDKLDVAVPATRYSQNTTLYAHFSHNQHRVTWDYSYALPNDQIGTIDAGNTNDRIKYGQLKFFYRDGSHEEWILDVAEATAFAATDEHTYATTGHTIVTGQITLNGNGSGTNGTSTWAGNTGADGAFTIALSDDKLAQFVGYEFVPMSKNNEGTIVEAGSTWTKTTKPGDHVTTFSFVGNQGDHCFPLKWTVTLSGLPIYPQTIFVQPMYQEGSVYKVITQTINTDGVECGMDNPSLGILGGDSRTYSGTYQVWKEGNNDEYNNKIGLTGFALNGQRYYLAKNNDGTPKCDAPVEHYISKDKKNESDDSYTNVVTWTKYNADNDLKVEMTMSKNGIPVLRLEKNADDATLSPTSPYIVVTTYDGEIPAPNTTFSATRPGYDFLGWSDTENGEVNSVYNNPIQHHTTSKTIYAVWKENIAPVITTDHIEYTQKGAKIYVSATDNVGVTSVQYIVSATEITNPEASDQWHGATQVPETVQYWFAAEIDKPYAYIYVKAEDAAGNKTIASTPNLKIDNIDPTYSIYPERNVCNFDCTITVNDNIQLQKVEVKSPGSADYVDVPDDWYQERTEDGVKMRKFVIAKPTEKGKSNGEGHYSLRITDAAENVTSYENFVNMIYDHNWDTEHPHTAWKNNNNGTFTEHTYYDCLNGCEHVWDVNHSDLGPISNYTHEYTKTGSESDEFKQHREQGLMRAETEDLFHDAGIIAVKDGSTVKAIANDLNDAISHTSDGNILTLGNNANVGTSGASSINAPESGTATLDLNGYGLLVDGNPADGQDGHVASITGNANVTILLKDNGDMGYTNKSKVTVSPISYARNFEACTKSRKGNWQALYIPFAVTEVPTGYTFGTLSSISITSTETKLTITKGTTSLEANGYYFVKSSEGTVNLSGTGLEPASVPVTPIENAGEKTTYSFKGSLTNSDNVAAEDASHFKTYWVLTNGGKFTWAALDSHQRPYHWVIYDTDISKQSSDARPMTIIEVEDDPTAIRDITVDEAEAAIYSLSGQRMPAGATLPSGIYVRNGKKIYVK